MTTRIMRDILKIEVSMNRGYEKSRYVGGRTWFTLSCGHITGRKNSSARNIGIHSMVCCQECTDLSKGRVTTVDNGDNTVTVHTWDKVRKMPVLTKRPRLPDEFEYAYRSKAV